MELHSLRDEWRYVREESGEQSAMIIGQLKTLTLCVENWASSPLVRPSVRLNLLQ